MYTIIIFVLILSLLVIVHEAGHFFMAKKFGMKVYEFGMGFPPRAFGVYKDPKTGKFVFVRGRGKSSLSETVGGEEKTEEDFPATLYTFNWLPLGGFVKIKGENGEDAKEKDSFGHHKAWKKLLVLVAGVVMNVLLAGILLGVGFIIGLPADISEGVPDGAVLVTEPAVVIQQVAGDSPADKAGLEFGDKVVKIDDVDILSSVQMIKYIGERGESEMQVSVERGEESLVLSITPEILANSNGEPKLGVSLADTSIIRYPWYLAIPRGFMAAFFGLINIFFAFYLLIKNLILGQGLIFEVSGPVGIASIVGQSARLGINYLINVTAMISLSLAAINILPIPALDGGRALFVIIEKVTKRPVPMRYEQLAHTIGFVLLMILIVIVTARDVLGLIS